MATLLKFCSSDLMLKSSTFDLVREDVCTKRLEENKVWTINLISKLLCLYLFDPWTLKNA